MKIIAIITRIGMVAYTTAIVLAIIFNALGFVIIDSTTINVLKVIYFVILLCAIVSYYKSNRKNDISIILFFLPIILLFTGIPFKVVTMILLVPLFFFKEIKSVRRWAGFLFYALFILIGIFGLALGGLSVNTVIDQKFSPNGVYRVVTIDNDQGALGGETYVKLEQIYFRIIKRNIKTLYHGDWGEKPNIKWVDNNIVIIDGREMDIHTSSTWENTH